MNGFIGFILLVVFVVVACLIAWVVYGQYRARKLGLPPPSLTSYNPFHRRSDSLGAPRPAATGAIGRFWEKIRHRTSGKDRSAGGAYEQPLSNVRGRQDHRGFGPLDPDDAWDARVGNEADTYGPGGIYDGPDTGARTLGGADATTTTGPRSLVPEPYIGGSQAGLNQRYDEEMGRTPTSKNPFGDEAETSTPSLRGMSPRPADQEARDQSPDSATERKSMFKEAV